MTSTIIARRGFLALYRETGFYGFGDGVEYLITNDGYGVTGPLFFDSDADAIAYFNAFEF